MKYILSLLVCLFIFGCSPQSFINKITPPEDDKLARELILNLRKNNLDFIVSNFDKSKLGKNPKVILSKLHGYIDKQEPKNIKLIGCNIFSSSNKRTSNLTYQIEFPNSWYTANIVIYTIGNSKKAIGFHINKIPDSLEKLNAFDFKNKGIKNYIILILAILVPLFIIVALVLCVKSKIKRKWLWIIFIFVGLGKIGINWTTGQILFQPISIQIQLFGSAFFRAGPYSPWVISTSLPLGAIIFLIKRKKLLIEKENKNEASNKVAPLDDICQEGNNK